MASNPKWCQPLSAWKRTFERWVNNPEPKEVMHATIFFDFRPGYGDLSLGQELRAHLNEILSGQELFFRFLAQDCLKTPAALNFFRQFVTEKSGQYKNRVDLKTKGITPFVDFARLTALRAKVNETNTLERLQQAGDLGGMSEELQMKAMQSFEFQMQLRLVHQWQIARGGPGTGQLHRPQPVVGPGPAHLEGRLRRGQRNQGPLARGVPPGLKRGQLVRPSTCNRGAGSSIPELFSSTKIPQTALSVVSAITPTAVRPSGLMPPVSPPRFSMPLASTVYGVSITPACRTPSLRFRVICIIARSEPSNITLLSITA